MKRELVMTLVFLCGTASLPAMADCPAPVAPTRIPDGKTANKQEMVAAMEMLKQYDADVNVYVKCLEFESRQSRLSSSEGQRRQTEAMTTLTSTAAKFNEQVRVFKAKAG